MIQQHTPNKNNGDSNISVKMIHCGMKCREISASRVSGRVCVCVRVSCARMFRLVSGLRAIGVPFNDSISTAEVIQRKQEDDGNTYGYFTEIRDRDAVLF